VEWRKALHKLLFQASYFLAGKAPVIKYYKEFMETQWWPYEKLLEIQLEQLQRLIHFSYEYVPYYRHLFDSISLKPNDIKSLQDLQKLPILTKRIIKEHWDEITPKNLETLKYTHGSTGGSTGEPLQYVMSYEDYVRGTALLYRGWSYGGYRLGDKMATIAGSSLISSRRSSLENRTITLLRNIRSYSSYGMSDETLIRYVRSLNEFKPEFLRGYASSLYILASFIRDKGLTINFCPRGVFTTAEKILEPQRRVIEEVFITNVFDTYGLNDGGVSAYECEKHCGMHIDMERAILEVVDENGHQVFDKPGKILATTLYNYAFPFIRYDTGDIGMITRSKCSCGRDLPLLKELVGRTTDVLTVKGRKVGSPVLTVLFGKFDIEQYQIIQEWDESLICRIVKGPMYSKDDEEFIRRSLISHVGPVDIAFEYVSSIEPYGGNKHKFIIDKRGDAREADYETHS
jgi:phenylacetate-CoA ligase